MENNKEFLLKNVEDLSAQQIADGIRAQIVFFEELKKTELFDASKQRAVKKILSESEAEDNAFNTANTLPLLEDFKIKFPNSKRLHEIDNKIADIKEKQAREEEENKQKQAEEEEREFAEIIRNNNKETPQTAKNKLGEEKLRRVCDAIGIDYNVVINYDEPPLNFSDIIPTKATDIPEEYTDVFFWGIPSSGKTCALSAILNTISKKYSMDAPPKKKFGTKYRDSLIELFTNDTGYLPSNTNLDRTQYMPFRIKKRGKGELYRNISFFELSGEIFRFIYDIINENVSTEIINNSTDEEYLTEAQKKENQKRTAFKTLNLLLNSDNQKIHFFFIDYSQATDPEKRQEQAKYLNAAATYFRDKNDIFKKKTDAVYIVVTKADEIKDKNGNSVSDEEKGRLAKKFLSENFGNFMDVIETRCDRDCVSLRKKIFSIGDVYFSKICKINRKYSSVIIDELLTIVKPPIGEYKWYSKFFKFFNS